MLLFYLFCHREGLFQHSRATDTIINAFNHCRFNCPSAADEIDQQLLSMTGHTLSFELRSSSKSSQRDQGCWNPQRLTRVGKRQKTKRKQRKHPSPLIDSSCSLSLAHPILSFFLPFFLSVCMALITNPGCALQGYVAGQVRWTSHSGRLPSWSWIDFFFFITGSTSLSLQLDKQPLHA